VPLLHGNNVAHCTADVAAAAAAAAALGAVPWQMGPSGSGKTTLLDLLAGRKTVGDTQGNIMFAGNKPTQPFLRRYTGYVEQFGELGVERLRPATCAVLSTAADRCWWCPAGWLSGCVKIVHRRDGNCACLAVRWHYIYIYILYIYTCSSANLAFPHL
jgi:hypothetical protein